MKRSTKYLHFFLILMLGLTLLAIIIYYSYLNIIEIMSIISINIITSSFSLFSLLWDTEYIIDKEEVQSSTNSLIDEEFIESIDIIKINRNIFNLD